MQMEPDFERSALFPLLKLEAVQLHLYPPPPSPNSTSSKQNTRGMDAAEFLISFGKMPGFHTRGNTGFFIFFTFGK